MSSSRPNSKSTSSSIYSLQQPQPRRPTPSDHVLHSHEHDDTATTTLRRSNEGLPPPPAYNHSTSSMISSSKKYPTSTTGSRSIAYSQAGAPRQRVSADQVYSDSKLSSNWTHLERPSTRTRSHRSGVSDRSRDVDRTREDDECASESAFSAVSAFRRGGDETRGVRSSGASSSRRQTDSPLRRLSKWMIKSGKSKWSLVVGIALVLWVKWSIGLGNYSGQSNASHLSLFT